MTTFAQSLARGRIVEGYIARWLMSKGCVVMPAYEIEISRGKGPQVFAASAEFVAPDLAVFLHGEFRWVEAKCKTVFTWYRKGMRWETGIDDRHYRHYLKVAKATKKPVWLFFLHQSSSPSSADLSYSSCPRQCPTGLFAAPLTRLEPCARFAPQHANGMVYWGVGDLNKMADLADVIGHEWAA